VFGRGEVLFHWTLLSRYKGGMGPTKKKKLFQSDGAFDKERAGELCAVFFEVDLFPKEPIFLGVPRRRVLEKRRES